MEANYFTIVWWFCHTLTWISHRCTCAPHPKPLFHLPPHPIPLGCPRAPALSALFHASNLDWGSISHMVIYIVQFQKVFKIILWDFLHRQSCHLWTKTFISSFPIYIYLPSPSLATFSMMLDQNSERRHPHFVSDLRGKASSFLPLGMSAVVFYTSSLSCWGWSPLETGEPFWELFIMNECWILSMPFLYLLIHS